MKPKIFVALPAYGRMTTADTAGSLFELGATLGANGIYGGFGTATHSDIAELRNVFLTAFFDKTEASHVLMIDADMRFRAALVMDMLKLNQPVVGVVYRKKSAKTEWVGRSLPESQEPVNGFMELSGIGGGVLLIRRDCVETLISKIPELVETDLLKHQAQEQIDSLGIKRVIRAFDKIEDEEGRLLSEDLSFCERWRSVGGKIYANISHDVCHLGLAEFGGSYQSFVASRTKSTVSLAG